MEWLAGNFVDVLLLGVVIALTLRRPPDVEMKTSLRHLGILIWPPLSAFRERSDPALARAWWSLRVGLVIATGIVVVFEMWRTGIHYRGGEAVTGRL